MSLMQWIILFVAVAAVILIYLRVRRGRDEDPWQLPEGQETAATEGPDYDRLDAPAEPATGAESYLMGEARVMGGAAAVAANPPPEPGLASGEAPDAKGWEHFSTRSDPQLGPQLGLEMERPEERRGSRQPAVSPGQEKIIVLHVAAPEGEAFAGPAVHTALQLCRLQYGMRDIYHRITEANGVPEAVYSVASMVKPGYLDPGMAQQFSTPGLTLFMVMPGPIEGALAFRDMLETAHRLAQRLGGDVLDDRRALLTHQSEQYLHDEIAETERRWRAQPRRK